MPLAENYRSLSPMPLALIDDVFRHVFDPLAHALDLEHNAFEVRYQPLEPGPQMSDPSKVGEVRYVVPLEQEEERSEEEEITADQGESAPVGDGLGRLQVRAVVEQLIGLHGQPRYTAGAGERRTLAWSDMAVLLPSRSTVLIELEKEFRRREVPFIVTKGIGFWQRQEIRDVINLVSCLADTGDELALFAVLRSPPGQMSDTEILFLSQLGLGSLMRGLQAIVAMGADRAPDRRAPEYKQESSQTYSFPAALEIVWREFPEQRKERLRKTAARLDGQGSWRRRVDRMAHGDLLQRCLEESGAYAIYAADAEGDTILANLERVFDCIRAEEQRAAPGLARLARWLRAQMDDSLKEEQATLAPGSDAIQIMTVHAAKGLEFPVVAIMKMDRMVGRCSFARLLVKNAGERLLKRDAAFLQEPRPGTVVVKVRHPRRPRETYTPCLFSALHRLDQAQELAESRRLFYVAATRAQERIILAGRQPSRSGHQPQSWQKWFEEALGIRAEQLSKEVWTDSARGYTVQIIREVPAGGAIGKGDFSLPDTALALDYLHEKPQTPIIATTSLEEMRAMWAKRPWRWWLKYRMQLDAHVKAPSSSLVAERGPATGSRGQLGTVVGTLVHRLLEMPNAWPQQSAAAFRSLLEAMAAGLLLSAPSLDHPEEEEVSIPADPETVRAIVDAVEHLWGRLHQASGTSIRELLQAAGETEVPFILQLGRWQVSGRYDKLLTTKDGLEIVDWKTDKDDEPETIVRRHEPQMRLYALALHRAGLAAFPNGKVRVHLAMLHPMRVKPVNFLPSDLDAFADELARELEQMEAYDPP
jgi:ATP-dependent helicase/nuclease subunit A